MASMGDFVNGIVFHVNKYCGLPSQKMQSHEQMKIVVDSGLRHLLQPIDELNPRVPPFDRGGLIPPPPITLALLPPPEWLIILVLAMLLMKQLIYNVFCEQEEACCPDSLSSLHQI